MTGILDMSWEDDVEIKSNEQNNLAINLRWASTSTVAVVTATTGPGQRGRTVYFRLWLSSCSQGGPLQWGVPTVTSYSYPKNFSPCQNLLYVHRAGACLLASWLISLSFNTCFKNLTTVTLLDYLTSNVSFQYRPHEGLHDRMEQSDKPGVKNKGGPSTQQLLSPCMIKGSERPGAELVRDWRDFWIRRAGLPNDHWKLKPPSLKKTLMDCSMHFIKEI